MAILNFIIRLFASMFLLGLCTCACLIPASPLLIICEKNQAKAKDFNKESLWAIAFCIIAFTTLAAGMGICIVTMQNPAVANFLTKLTSQIS